MEVEFALQFHNLPCVDACWLQKLLVEWTVKSGIYVINVPACQLEKDVPYQENNRLTAGLWSRCR